MRKQMKNILLAGACAAMVCSAVCGVSAWQAPVAQADEATPVLEIGRKNLLLEDNIQIMFQVKTDNAIVSDSDVKLLVWTQPQEAYTYGTQNTVIGYNANKTFEEEPYYVYTELAIKQMTDDVYVCAYANVDGTEPRSLLPLARMTFTTRQMPQASSTSSVFRSRCRHR